jgi:hypothetical protein
MSHRTTWIITASGERPLAEVADDLARAGLTVDAVLDAIGIITGSADAAATDALRDVPGVTDVSPDQAIDIGPPDAPATW